MKTKINLTVMAIVLAIQVNAQSFYGRAGATFTTDPSYYVGIGTTGKLTDRAGFLGEANYASEKGTAELKTVSGTFAFKIHIIERLTIEPGFQLAYNLSSDLSGEEEDKLSKGSIAGVAGLSFMILKRLGIQGRYIYYGGEHLFNQSIQAGLTYTIK